MIKKKKEEFLNSVGYKRVQRKSMEEKRKWAATHSMNASLARGYVYKNAACRGDIALKEDWLDALVKAGGRYKKTVSENAHIQVIESIAHSLSKNHGRVLRRGKMRIGTSQKALNLYLKYLWCLGEISCPLHCPLDSIVLRAAGISGSWTQLDSVAKYKEWIARCKNKAASEPLSHWELDVWADG